MHRLFARPLALGTFLSTCAFAPFVITACGSDDPAAELPAPVAADAGADTSIGTGHIEAPDASFNTTIENYDDFGATPIVDPSAPTDTAAVFAAATSAAGTAGVPSGGPCLIEPEPTSMYPKNWLRPRFRWQMANGPNPDQVFELRLHVQNQKNDLVVYTKATSWTMPKDMWTALAAHSADRDMTMSMRSGTLAKGALAQLANGASGPLRIAPVEAPGSIVYWTTTARSLKGFRVGDESVVDVLRPPQFSDRAIDCVGCHASSPDGDFVGFATKLESPSVDQATEYASGISAVASGSAGQDPAWLGAGAKQALAQPYRGQVAFTRGHWSAGDRLMVTQLAAGNPASTGDLSWVNLEAADLASATGIIARSGDPGVPVAPSWSHDGNTIAYTSAASIYDTRADTGPIDIYTVPFANKAGGAATKLLGASDPAFDEHYPAYSPDDRLLAFVRVPARVDVPGLFDPKREVYVIPSAGGTPTRLAANDPPACTGQTSPGMSNSYAKWAPKAETVNGRTYYWVVFSSKRIANPDGSRPSKLFLTPVTIDGSGAITTYGAIYLWNQPDDEDGHTPAWDYFNTPPVPSVK